MAVPAAPLGDFSMALVSAITMDLPNQHPTVVLRETESPRRQLSFSVGLPDAVVLSHALRRIPTPRPLTHELLSDVLQGFDIDVVAVRLVGRQGRSTSPSSICGDATHDRCSRAVPPTPWPWPSSSRCPCPSSSTAGSSSRRGTFSPLARWPRRREPAPVVGGSPPGEQAPPPLLVLLVLGLIGGVGRRLRPRRRCA